MTYLAFDTETTGLYDSCNVLTAFFIILDEDLNEIDSLDLKIKYPFYTIYTKAMEINKINLLEHEKDAVSKADAINMLELFLTKNKKQEKFHIMGHNICFDKRMLISNGIFTENIINNYISENQLDTLIIARK
jgi:DNA polymerase III alpha subunit (gram-positive type)